MKMSNSNVCYLKCSNVHMNTFHALNMTILLYNVKSSGLADLGCSGFRRIYSPYIPYRPCVGPCVGPCLIFPL